MIVVNQDLTVGKPGRVLWKFCLPLFGSIVFQQLYNIADSLIAGKILGEDALASVGNSYEVTLLFIAFAFGCNIGCSVVVSRLFGAKNYRDVKTAVTTAYLAGGTLCLVLMALGWLSCDWLLSLIQTPVELMADCRLYLFIYIGGLPFLFFYNISNGIFSALGDSTTPFRFLAVSSVANVGMDILFLTAFGMGVEGVAWATFLCQGVSCVLAVWLVFRRLRTLPKESGMLRAPLFSLGILGEIARIAIPSILQQSFVSVGNMIIQGFINGFGSIAVIAGYSAAIKLNNLVITSFTTLGNGISNFTAQNLGAGKGERIRDGFRAGLRMVWLLSLPIVALYLLAGRWLVFLFMNQPTGGAIDTGVLILRILVPFYFLIALKLVADGVLRGAGKMVPFMISTFTDLILRVVLAWVLSTLMQDSLGIWLAWPIGWGISSVMSYLFYRFRVIGSLRKE